ncbi:MAG TPA: GNAT family protein [Bacteroidia bacterium]|jgi:ribosomal-protein-serine acetyltransferase|nr:GNAT family protein [Bacteroidia bacterium]
MKFDHYILRVPELNDAALLLKMVLKDKERLVDYFPVSVGSMVDISSTKKYILEKIQQIERKEAFTFILHDTKVLKPIGVLFIKSIDWRTPKAELAYFIDKEQEGKGITGKALKHIINYGFNTLKMNKLFLRVAPENIASQRVALKNGFAKEGILRKDFKRANGKLTDVYYYGLVKE